MSAGVGQVIAGVPFSTVRLTVAVAPVKFTASIGVKVTDSGCDPASSTVPAAGAYANVPGTLLVALSCVALNAVPYVMSAGVDHVIAGVPFSTVRLTVAVAPVKFTASVGVNVTDSGCAPASRTVLAAGVYANVPE